MYITKKHVYDAVGYEITAPVLTKKPFKKQLIESLFLSHRACAMCLHNLPLFRRLPSPDRYDISPDDFTQHDNSASIQTDGQASFFNIERIIIMEMIPKELVEETKNGINSFVRKHCHSDFDHSAYRVSEVYGSFYEGDASLTLNTGGIRPSSPLSKYISSIHFRLNNLSSTFCSLHIRVNLNKDLANKLSTYAVSRVDDISYVYVPEYLSLLRFYRAGYGVYSGDIHKSRIIDSVLHDVTWNITRHLSATGIPTLLYNHRTLPPVLVHVETNISGHSHRNFWNSLSINTQLCDYSESYSFCLAWRCSDQDCLPFCISSPKNDITVFEQMRATRLDYNIAGLLIPDVIDTYIRKTLPVYMRRINRCQRFQRNAHKKLLKLKKTFDSDLFYFVRFIHEFEHVPYEITEGHLLHRIPYKDNEPHPSLTSLKNKGVMTLVKKLSSDYNQFLSLFTSALDYYAARSNLHLQIVAVIVSIIAIIISLADSETARSLLTTAHRWLLQLFQK